MDGDAPLVRLGVALTYSQPCFVTVSASSISRCLLVDPSLGDNLRVAVRAIGGSLGVQRRGLAFWSLLFDSVSIVRGSDKGLA